MENYTMWLEKMCIQTIIKNKPKKVTLKHYIEQNSNISPNWDYLFKRVSALCTPTH